MQCLRCCETIPDGSLFCSFCGKKQGKDQPRKRANGEGSVYKDFSGWTAVKVHGYKLADGKSQPIRSKKRGFKTKLEALDALAAMTAKRNREKEVSFQGLYDKWMEEYLKL